MGILGDDRRLSRKHLLWVLSRDFLSLQYRVVNGDHNLG